MSIKSKKLLIVILALSFAFTPALANNELRQLNKDIKDNSRANYEESKKSGQEIMDTENATQTNTSPREAGDRAKIEHYKTMKKHDPSKTDEYNEKIEALKARKKPN